MKATRPEKRKVAGITSDGHFQLIEQDTPDVENGMVLVEVHASLVSPGSNLGGGWKSFSERRLKPVEDRPPRPTGYSNAGIVIGLGDGVQNLAIGDRVACIGGGYALIADYAVIPHHLCVKLPDSVTFEQGSYGMLSATALHALRRGAPTFGDFVAVVGLGLVGQLAARMHQLAGNYVVGWDMIPFRIEVARKWGIDEAVTASEEDVIVATNRFTGGQGLDGGVMAFGGDGNSAIRSLGKCMKRSPDGHPMGTIVVVGNPTFEYRSHEAGMTNIDIRRASRTGAGYHDGVWERGMDYQAVFMRWTTQTNLALCMRLIAEEKLDVNALTTHRIPLDRVEEGTAAILDDPDSILGVIFTRPV